MHEGVSLQAAPPAPLTFWSAFGFWLKLGFISFGGPPLAAAERNR